MSKIVDFKHLGPPKGPSKQPSLKDKFGYDADSLGWVAEWRAARAQMQKNWAEYDLAAGWGTLPSDGIKLDSDPLERMKELEYRLAALEPQTMLLARELLRMAVTILAYTGEDPNPDSTLGNGPVLEIVRNVLASLEHCKAEMRIGPTRPEA
jgi:hypothetical protein